MSKPTIANQLQTSVQELARLKDDDLELKLGGLLAKNSEEFELLGDVPLGRTTDFLRNLANSFLNRLSRSLYSLVCDDKDPEYEKVQAALGSGAETLGYVLACTLAASFGILPGVAAIAGTIVAKRIIKSGHGAVCESWKKSLK